MKNSFPPVANKRGIRHQGCQMVYFQTKNPNLGIFWSALACRMSIFMEYFYYHLEYFTAIFKAKIPIWVYFGVPWYGK
jgi:hypothetical protein